MSEKKITKAQRFGDIIRIMRGESVEHGTTIDEAVAVMEHELSLLAKKNTGTRKKSAKDVENERLQALIVEYLQTQTAGITASAIKAGVPDLNGDAVSLNKVVGLLRGITRDDEDEDTFDRPLRKYKVKTQTLFATA